MGAGIRQIILGIALLSCSFACAPAPRGSGGFNSADPADRLVAIQRAASVRDEGAVPRLIALLSSSDGGERMMAINALRQITGTDMDYNPYAPLAERDMAVDRWRQAWREGRLTPTRPQ